MRQRLVLLVSLLSGCFFVSAQTGNRAFRLDRETWKATAEQDYSLAQAEAAGMLEERILAEENAAEPAYQLGYCEAMTLEFHKAQYWYELSLEEMRGLEEPKSSEEREFISALLNNLGVCAMNLGHNAEAAEYFREAKNLVSVEEDEQAFWETSLNEAVMAGRAGNLRTATALYQDVEGYFREISNDLGLAMLDYNRGGMHALANDSRRALPFFTAAERGFLNVGDSMRASIACLERIRILIRKNEGEEMLAPVLDQFKSLTKDHPSPQFSFVQTLAETVLLVEEGQFMKAREKMSQLSPSGWMGADKWRADLALIDARIAGHLDDAVELERVIFGLEEAANADFDEKLELQVKQDAEVAQLSEIVADLYAQRERNSNERSIQIRNWSILGIVAVSLALFFWGYRQHRKGQRFLFTIISRRLREQLDARSRVSALDGLPLPANKEVSDDLFTKIEELMRNEKPHLDCNLTVAGLAQLVEANYTYTSKAIQTGAGLGVSEYINRYRVDHVMDLMLDPEKANLSFEQIAEVSGFNSVSTLYRQFNRYAGMTPGAFRKAINAGIVG